MNTNLASTSSPSVGILKKPSDRITDDTRQALLKTGLITALETVTKPHILEEGEHNNTQQTLESRKHGVITDVTNKSLAAMEMRAIAPTVMSREGITQDRGVQPELPKVYIVAYGESHFYSERQTLNENNSMGPNDSIIPVEQRIVNVQNQFSVLDTTNPLQAAFENLQLPVDKKEESRKNNQLVIISIGNEQYLSDDAGTNDTSNVGVHFSQYVPNLESEHEGEQGAARKRKGKKKMVVIRRSTRAGKDKIGTKTSNL